MTLIVQHRTQITCPLSFMACYNLCEIFSVTVFLFLACFLSANGVQQHAGTGEHHGVVWVTRDLQRSFSATPLPRVGTITVVFLLLLLLSKR